MEEDEHIFIFSTRLLLFETQEELEELMIASCLRNERESVHSWEDWLEKKRSRAFSRNFIYYYLEGGGRIFFSSSMEPRTSRVATTQRNNAKWKDNTAKK